MAASIAVFVRELALSFGHPQVGTVGAITLHPNLINVVPGRVIMTVDLRNTDEMILQRAEHELEAYCQALAAVEGVTISSRVLARFEPVTFDSRMVDLVASTAAMLTIYASRAFAACSENTSSKNLSNAACSCGSSGLIDSVRAANCNAACSSSQFSPGASPASCSNFCGLTLRNAASRVTVCG